MTLNEHLSASPRGTAKLLADALTKATGRNISPSYISQLVTGKAPISPKLAVAIETVTENKVSRQDLFPNDWKEIWPELTEQ